MSQQTRVSSRRAVALFVGTLILPVGLASASEPVKPPVAPVASVEHDIEQHGDATFGKPKVDPQKQIPSESCLAETVCAVKGKMMWKNAAKWSPSYCRLIARGLLDSAAKYDLPPTLLLAVMINESDLNEKAVNTTMRGGVVYAKDSGLMGIRCILDSRGRCSNGPVKGLAWTAVMDPLKNIELGARELARYRDGGGVDTVTMRVRDKSGRIVTKTKNVSCKHKTHAYWAHYNHGPRYIGHGRPRHYPHRVAVIYYSLAQAMNLDAPELREMRITVNDPGLRPRTPDRPVERRYRELCAHIKNAGGVCGSVADARPSLLN